MPSQEKTEALVKEWLSEYKTLSESEVHTYASTVRYDDRLTEALYSTLQHENRQEVLEPVCHQLFEFYKSSETDLRRFALEFVPILITSYLHSISTNRKKTCSSIESLLLGIYNLEVVGAEGAPKVKTFTIPSLSRPSVYHEPNSQAPLALIESSLSQHNQDEHRLVTWGPFPQVASITANNRMNVLTFVLHCYNNTISELSLTSQKSLCESCIRLCQSGFETLWQIPHDDEEQNQRISLNDSLLLETLSGIYYVMYNSDPSMGRLAVNAIARRASYELYADIMMVTNAIKNSLKIASQDGEELSLLSASTTTPAFAKAALTNASFKAKKLPDDIPVPSDDEDVTSQHTMPVGSDDTPPPAVSSDRRMSETDRVLMSDKMKMAIKSALKKTDRTKKETKLRVTLHTANGESESERRMSTSSLPKTDSVEMKSYASDRKWDSIEEDTTNNADHEVTFNNQRSRPVIPTINTEV